MRNLKLRSHRVLFFTIILLVVLCGGCRKVDENPSDANSNNETNQSDAKVDILVVPDLSNLEVVKDYDVYNDVYQGRIGVEKLWTLTPENYIYVSGEIPFIFPTAGPDDFSKPNPFVGYGFGVLKSVIHAYGSEGSCTITTHAEVDLELRGVLYGPPDCTLAFEVKSIWVNGTVTDECSGAVLEAPVDDLATDISRDIFLDIQNPYLHQSGPYYNFLWYVQAFNQNNESGIPCGTVPFRIIPAVDEAGNWAPPSDLGEIPQEKIE